MDKYDLRDKLVLKFISRNLSWGMLKHDVSDLTPFDGEDLDVEQIYIQELKKSDVKWAPQPIPPSLRVTLSPSIRCGRIF